MVDIYSDIRAEILVSEMGDKRLYLYDEIGMFKPKLILPNLLAIKNLRDYLDRIIKENKEYFDRV